MRNLALTAFLLAGCSCSGTPPSSQTTPPATQVAQPPPAGQAVAIFSGGCFWCMEAPFDHTPGVASTTSGYTGGRVRNPSYEQVSSGDTGHAESIRVVYDPTVITYQQLLDVFWHNIDPTDAGGQFCDRGNQYRSAIWTLNDEQRRLAVASKQHIAQQLGQEVVTEISDAGPFYEAEAYHQDFYRTNPVRYQTYRTGCGRDRRLQELWGESAGGH